MSDELGCHVRDIASIELNICDTQPSCLGGANNEFIFSGRLDNLASSFCALRALVDTCASPEDLENENKIRMIALFDNEEVYYCQILTFIKSYLPLISDLFCKLLFYFQIKSLFGS